MILAPIRQPAAPSFPPVGGTASAIVMAFGDWFARMGAAGGGVPVGPTAVELRFGPLTDAAAAVTLLEPVVDGVRLDVRRQDDGSVPGGPAAGAALAARLLERVPGVRSVDVTDSAFVVTSFIPDTNAKLDWIVRDEIGGLPVVWQTLGP